MNKVLLVSHISPPTTGIGSWTGRVIEKGIPGWEIGIVNSNMIGNRDPFKNTKINFKDEVIRCFNIWKNEIHELKNNTDYKIVHTNIPCTIFGMMRETITGVIAKRYKKVFIVHCHCTLSNVINSKMKLFFFKIMSKMVDGYIVLNSKSLDFIEQNRIKKNAKIIPNFVCKDEIIAKERKFDKKICNVLYVGGVSEVKGCDTIIKAAYELPQVVFHLVGIISDEIKKMEIPKNVILYGNKDKQFVKEIMLTSDLFVFLSKYYGEGFSVALVEAMSSGLPCIVTDWAANADMVCPQGGVVINQDSPDELIEKIIYYDNNYEKRVLASKSNVSKVSMEYVDIVVLKKISEFYEELLKRSQNE